MAEVTVLSFVRDREAGTDCCAGQVKECPYPPGDGCFMEPETPGEYWCTTLKCWLFGEHLREWADAHPIANSKIGYSDTELSTMLTYAQGKAKVSGARLGG
jgi:hypothetical protein